MATYTVIQDIEAEDKLLGPLTLKQFIFASITVLTGYLSFWSLTSGLPFLLVLFLPPTLFFGALAFPWSKDQPTEVWMLAKIRFYFRPRKRIWDQAGIKELVTITAPKIEEKHYTDGLSNREVKSRLKTLADTIDSRGWAVKNDAANFVVQPAYAQGQSDRLIQPAAQPQQNITYDTSVEDDMLDISHNPESQRLGQMIQESSTKQHDELIEKINLARSHTGGSGAPGPAQQPTMSAPNTDSRNDYWFMREPQAPTKPGTATFSASPIVSPGQAPASKKTETKTLTPEEQATLEKIHQQKSRPDPMNSHLKTILPLSQQQQEEQKQDTTTEKPQNITDTEKAERTDQAPQKAKPDILEFARNDDLSVETIARQAEKVRKKSDNEVEVSLH